MKLWEAAGLWKNGKLWRLRVDEKVKPERQRLESSSCAGPAYYHPKQV